MLIVCMNSFIVRFFISNILLPSAIHSQSYIVHFALYILQLHCRVSAALQSNRLCHVTSRADLMFAARVGERPLKPNGYCMYHQV